MNAKADYVSKVVDHDDWGVSMGFFRRVDERWGPHTVDCFASYHNKKTVKFYSRFWTPGTAVVDSFAFGGFHLCV